VSERPSEPRPSEPGPPESRERLLWPILIPVAALVVIGLVLFLFSRVLLHVTPLAATITALIVAASILGVATVVASRPQVTGASLLTMVGGVLGIAMFAGGLALILGQPAEELQPVVVTLTAPVGAATKGFEQTELSGPASYPITIAFTNDDTGVQHNVVVTQEKTTDPAGAIATGAAVIGPGSADVAVPNLAQGSYYFFCEFHPQQMTGTLTIAGPPPAPGQPTGPVVTANSTTAFDPNTLQLTAGQPTTITFDNEDPGIQHNLDVFGDKDYTQEIAKTPDVTGVGTGQVALPALDPGTYYFRCDFHPTTMTGTITVSGGGGGGAPPSGASPGGSASSSPSA
jgi:plastocyanin